MNKLIEVAVTEEDIKEGKNTSYDSPVARAIKRSLKTASVNSKVENVSTKAISLDVLTAPHYPSHVFIFEILSNGKMLYNNFLPTEASALEEKFMRGEKVEPITFSLEIPETIF